MTSSPSDARAMLPPLANSSAECARFPKMVGFRENILVGLIRQDVLDPFAPAVEPGEVRPVGHFHRSLFFFQRP